MKNVDGGVRSAFVSHWTPLFTPPALPRKTVDYMSTAMGLS